MHLRVYIFLVYSVSFVIAEPNPCPFEDSNSCSCTGVRRNIIQTLKCSPKDGNYVPVSGPAGVYTIAGTFEISTFETDLTIPANAFTAFASIKLLDISQHGAQRNLILDPSAFNGTTIVGLSAKKFQNLLPVLPAVKNLGRNGLNELSILYTFAPKSLIANDFIDFRNLTSLYFGYLTIDQVSDVAFAGLENNLVKFEFDEVTIPEFPINALNRLTNLVDIKLYYNNFSAFPAAAFSSFQNLRYLYISGSAVPLALTSEALDKVPSSTQQLWLDDGGLTQVPKIPLSVPWLSLESNQINNVRKGDFPAGNSLRYLSLSYNNHLSKIDPEAMQELNLVGEFRLQKSSFTALDLSVFNGMNELRNVLMSINKQLKNVTVSAPEKVPATIEYIDLSSCSALQRVDSSLQAILDRAMFKQLDISLTKSFICDDTALWLAKYVLCDPMRVNTDYTVCANMGQRSVYDWLAEKVPNACQ